MPNFIFEIIRAGDDPQVVEELSLPDFAAAWCNVEMLAFKLRKRHQTANRKMAIHGIRSLLQAAASRQGSAAHHVQSASLPNRWAHKSVERCRNRIDMSIFQTYK